MVDECDCRDEFGGTLPGVLFSHDGVQRCDDCARYPGDLEAAAAVAALFDGEVWFCPDGQLDPVRWDGSDDVVIAEGTDPWVRAAGRVARPDVLAETLGDNLVVRRAANTLVTDGGGCDAADAAEAARLLVEAP